MNAIRLPFSIWWLRWLLFARFSLMLPSLCWLAAWMDGWMAGWLTGIAVVTVPRFVRNSLLCLVSVVMPLFRPQLNNPNQSSTTSMIDVNRSIGILYGKNFERIFFLVYFLVSLHLGFYLHCVVECNASDIFAITVGHAHSFGIVFRFAVLLAVLMHHRVYVRIGIMLSSLGFLTKQIFLSKLAHFILFFFFFFFCALFLA